MRRQRILGSWPAFLEAPDEGSEDKRRGEDDGGDQYAFSQKIDGIREKVQRRGAQDHSGQQHIHRTVSVIRHFAIYQLLQVVSVLKNVNNCSATFRWPALEGCVPSLPKSLGS